MEYVWQQIRDGGRADNPNVAFPVIEMFPWLLADLRRYRDWCRRLVASEGDLDDIFLVMNEVRAALEDKSCTCGEDDGTEPKLPHKTWCPKAEE